jgi:hypothetical protein
MLYISHLFPEAYVCDVVPHILWYMEIGFLAVETSPHRRWGEHVSRFPIVYIDRILFESLEVVEMFPHFL